VALELNSLSKTIWQDGSGNGVRKCEAIDAILKVKSNMDSGMFSEFKRTIAALNSDKSWFDSMNEIQKNAAF
jgi:aspartate/methionine/tyrosine aminotransferase